MSRPMRREYLGTLLLLAAGGVLGLVSAGRSWAMVHLRTSFAESSTAVSGNDLAPLVSAVPLVALAAVVLVPAVRGAGRRVAGGLLVLLAGAAIAATVVVAADLRGRVRQWVLDAPGQSDSVVEVTTYPAWPALVMLGSVMVAVAGGLIALRGPAWPGMGSRYERPGSARGTGRQPKELDTTQSKPNPAEAWDALDRGDDPTA
ncbi:Trp biosynthesis-associated membrane protein [Phytoactinopolyspora alkaliphila]|uniref:Trp biosynthesis-associated membrane protein n=1 Tax=Phytoactinopolyspora alkaliphila TaxID=1783498 RepID=A0A6N9YG53_9ACTN|nr:Trp biosynthesis-associated membrane protein [Phytoactinopolyspora alkaliphila]NED93859.1 Trp biosynthesis-associated membrane protein [Phytoactinopolyspora alkaliphila]